MKDDIPQKQGLYDPRFEHDACGIGMLVNIKGKRTHGLISDSLKVLTNLTHRAGVGAEPDSGDGAGILFQMPHKFMRKACAGCGIKLPRDGEYGVAMMFVSPDRERRAQTLEMFKGIVESEGLEELGVRVVPTYPDAIGNAARNACPAIRQVFIRRPKEMSCADFERKLYVVSKLAVKQIRDVKYLVSDPYFYLASISSRTIVYKGMLVPRQMAEFYVDLKDEDMESAIALVHSRYSTNTFPSWERAHPIQYLIHNGEINTIRGNVNWIKARESLLISDKFGDDLKKVLPIINEDGSDSAMLDDFLKFMLHSGCPLPHALMMAIPEPWEKDESISPDKKAFYQYNSCLMEPWDGPAALAFTDGEIAGATLDRNGLRPSRYYITNDDMLILSSEVGVLDIPEKDIVRKDRLRPGKMLLIDTKQGRIIGDDEIKKSAAAAYPYKKWVDENILRLDDIPAGRKDPLEIRDLLREEKVFGYTNEDIQMTLKPMAETSEDPISSMGIDTPLAVLSDRPQLLYNYFKQMFAQVTNPPLDALREDYVTSSCVQIGSEGNILRPCAENCHMITHTTPVISDEDLCKLRNIRIKDFYPMTLSALFNAAAPHGLKKALDRICSAGEKAVRDGYNIIILSDRDADAENAPIPALLATAALHHHLIRNGIRTRAGIIVETGEAREVHHLAALIGYGANMVNPYLAYKIIENMADMERLKTDKVTALSNYRLALTKGLIKTISKMGISTVRSYQGAQIFEALGISEFVVNEYFTGTTTRIGGLSLKEIEQECLARHSAAFEPGTDKEPLSPGGEYKWCKDGEYHLFNPESIAYLHDACVNGDYKSFQKYTELVSRRSDVLKNLRSLLNMVTRGKPLPLDEIEPAESIVRRFKVSAMSYGSISPEAHECIAIAMNRLHAKSNCGEGGEDPARWELLPNGDDRCSAIKQVASGRFGVTINYLNNASEIEIKMGQGAKPGEGGHLPANKIYPWIAKSRNSVPGVALISPPPHHDIYSIEDLAQLINDLKNANPSARITVKLVSEAGIGTIAVGVAKGLADGILISGYDGGTGAAARSSIRHTGLPWELGLAEAHQTLLLNNLRNRVRLEVDGKMLTGRDVVIAALLGAEEFGFATTPLIAIGCRMMRVCNLDTCPFGIATQNPELRKKFAGKPEYIQNFMMFLAEEVREWMAKLGIRDFNDLIGHAELLRTKYKIYSDKARTLDFSNLLFQPSSIDSKEERYFNIPQRHMLRKSLDRNTLIPLCEHALDTGKKIGARLHINNTHRTVGSMLSSEISRRFGLNGLPDNSIHLRFDGSAGQSFGAFLAKGITLELHGDSNDHVGKGLSGGRIIVMPPCDSEISVDDNVIIGNVALYGATSGEAYIRGIAGERFCVRNSGATAVAEGAGNHACEYMTGGRTVILGSVGKNFGAGMSGGIAYLYDPKNELPKKANKNLTGISRLSADDASELHGMIEKHFAYTGSKKAEKILQNFGTETKNFVKVMPDEYRRVLLALKEAKEKGVPEKKRMMYAFDAVTKK